jgi:phospholipid/cholesterol/gamma-HCH transport system substrate-binding protein
MGHRDADLPGEERKMVDMNKQLMWSKLKVGLVISSSLLLLVFGAFFAGGIEDLFSPKIALKAQMQDVKGLRKGAPVWVSGIEIGYVMDIQLHQISGTLVTLSVRKSAIEYINKDSVASVMTMGLLGDKYVELSSGTPEAGRISPGDSIPGTTQVEFKDVIENSAKSLQRMTDVINKLDNIITKIDNSEGTLSKFLIDPSLYNNLKATSGSLATLMKNVESSRGTVRMLIDDPALYQKMLAATSSIEEFSRKANEGTGTLKKLIEDPSLYDDLDKTAKKLSVLVDRIDHGEGLAGSLVRDEELSREFKETIVELKTLSRELGSLTKDIKENPKRYFKFSLF